MKASGIITSLTIDLYTTDWIRHDEFLNYGNGYHRSASPMPCPVCLEEMLNYASILSEHEPQARIDFYERFGKPVFGEITLTSCGGKMSYFKQEFLTELGDKISQQYFKNKD